MFTLHSIRLGLGGLELVRPFTCKSCFCIRMNYFANAVYPEVPLYCAGKYTDLFTLVCFVLFAIFILHSRESELYRYTLGGKSALAWELPFSRFMGHLSST